MALFVPLDVDYQFDPKVIAAGCYGECLFNRSLALSKRTLSDGKVSRHQLAGLCLGIPGRPAKHAATLVDVGLWSIHRDGWTITAWAKRNQSAETITAKAERKKASAIKANHERWHCGENAKPSDSCPLCYPDAIRVGSDSESTESESEEETHPEEEAETETSEVSRQHNLRVVGDDERDDDPRIHAAIQLHATIMAERNAKPPARAKYRLTVAANDMTEHFTELLDYVRMYPDAFRDQVDLPRVTANELAMNVLGVPAQDLPDEAAS